MFRKADSSGDLAPAVERLHALADRLESVLSKVVVAGGATGVASAAAANHAMPPPPSTSAPSSSSSASSPLSDWASRVAPALARLRDACSQTAGDPEIEALTRVLEDAFRAEEAVLKEVAAAPSSGSPPDDAALERLLAPVAAVAEEARALANPPGGRGRPAPKRLNQAKAVSELVPALLWVAYSGPSCGMSPPPQHVDESWQAAEFFANKAAADFRGGGSGAAAPDAAAQASWLRELRALATALKEHVSATAPQGPAWGVGGGGGGGGGGGAVPAAAAAPPQPQQQRRAAPPPPPPPPPPGGPGSLLKKEQPAAAPAAAAAAGGGMAAVLAAIASKGDGATRGLRKVTDDMKSKNRSDRTGAVPASSASSAAAAAAAAGAHAATSPASSSKKPASLPPPRLACEQGRKWVVENYRGGGSGPGQQHNHDPAVPVVVDEATAKQSVYVFGCSDVVVRIATKVNAVSVDSCRRVAVEVLGGAVASVEAVNCSSLVLRDAGGAGSPVLTWALDKCSGVSLQLSRASLEGDAQVTTAQCSEVNIVLPAEGEEGGNGGGDDDDDFGPKELPVPEQFVTRVVAGRLVTEPVAHSGA